MALGHLHERLSAVRSRIAAAAARAGRDPAAVRIVAVTKGHPLTTALEAVAAGLLDLGENRVQEALGKMDAWPQTAVRWHLVGHLQRNKAKLAVGRFALIHSLDSARLADALEAEAAARGLPQDVLVEVNVARRGAEGRVPSGGGAGADGVRRRPGARQRARPHGDGAADRRRGRAAPRVRAAVRAARGSGGAGLPPAELSMGMTNDFEAAVEEGATMVRLGTALFGERPT